MSDEATPKSSAVLQRAVQLLEEGGWTKDVFRDDRGSRPCYCALGAVIEGLGMNSMPVEPEEQIEDPRVKSAMKYLNAAAIPYNTAFTLCGGLDPALRSEEYARITATNDRGMHDKRSVIKWFGEAIALAKKEESNEQVG